MFSASPLRILRQLACQLAEIEGALFGATPIAQGHLPFILRALLHSDRIPSAFQLKHGGARWESNNPNSVRGLPFKHAGIQSSHRLNTTSKVFAHSCVN